MHSNTELNQLPQFPSMEQQEVQLNLIIASGTQKISPSVSTQSPLVFLYTTFFKVIFSYYTAFLTKTKQNRSKQSHICSDNVLYLLLCSSYYFCYTHSSGSSIIIFQFLNCSHKSNETSFLSWSFSHLHGQWVLQSTLSELHVSVSCPHKGLVLTHHLSQ